MKSNSLRASVVGLALLAGIGCGNDNNFVQTANNPLPIPTVSPTVTPVAPKAVYTMTNETANRILTFNRADNGGLVFTGSTSTGGNGTNAGLNGSSNGLVFDVASNRMFCVNAGSNSISMLNLNTDGSLSPQTPVNSGGTRPISVTAFGDLLYVLNQGNGGAGNISGFRVVGNNLTPIAGSTQLLSSPTPNPAQIQFNPSGNVLVVSERDTNSLVTYALTAGVAGAPQVFPASGVTPFGFEFTRSGILVVTNASVVGGAPTVNGSTASTYSLSAGGVLTTVSNAVLTGGTASCWAAMTSGPNPFAFVTNTAGNTLSSFTVSNTGVISGVVANAGSANTGPVDARVSDDDRFLYVLNGGTDTISVYGIQPGGALIQQPGINGLPASTVGMVAR